MQVVKELPERAIALPEDLDQYEEQRAEIEGWIATGEDINPPAALILMNSDQAAEAARRRAYHIGLAQDVARPYDAEIARIDEKIAALRMESGRLALERDAASKPHLNRAFWYEAPLEAFMRALAKANAKIKTWPTPWGELKLRAQQPEWNYGDEKALGQWLHTNAPQFTKVEPVAIKPDLKKAVKVREDGSVVLLETGETIPGIKVTEREPKFEIELKGA